MGKAVLSEERVVIQERVAVRMGWRWAGDIVQGLGAGDRVGEGRTEASYRSALSGPQLVTAVGRGHALA